MFQLSGISKSFGGQVLFEGLSWPIRPGDRVGLVGPNGVGKTTLLRILAGEQPPDEGQVIRPRGSRVGYLPQEIERHDEGDVLSRVMDADEETRSVERRLAQVEELLAVAQGEQAEKLSHEHGDLIERFAVRGGYDLESRTREILAGLGFADDEMSAPLASLSGGWVMRVELARLLLTRPELLLLDEPTNHLDLESIQWMEAFLDSYEGAWVVVSHDRYFLNRMVTRIVELDPQGLFVYDGDYDSFVEARALVQEQLQKQATAHKRRVKEIQGFIDRFRAQATKARQAQSRVKLLEKMEAQAEHDPRANARRRKVRIQLPQPARGGATSITLEEVDKSYGDRVVYRGCNFQVRRGEKIALLGENGAGKSTLLKILAGEISIDRGERKLGHNVEVFYFAQHQAEALDSQRSVLETLWEVMPTEAESRVRGLLGSFLFSGDDVEKKVRVLSGGEKSRLALAKMLARPANLLLLDEPTNHLDLQSRDVLEAALAEFPGSIVFISHDRYFINHVCTRVVEVLVGGRVVDYPGNYDYFTWKRGEVEKVPRRKKEKGGNTKAEARARRARAREEQKAEARAEAKRARKTASLEDEISVAEQRIEEIDALLCDEAVYADGARTSELLAERERLESSVPKLYEKWEALGR